MTSKPRTFVRLLCGTILVILGACASAGGLAGPSNPRVLTVGGHASHDFPRWFHRADSTTLAAVGAVVSYTAEPSRVYSALDGVDVLYMTANQALPDPAMRQRIMGLLQAGKGIIVGHPGAWYNWSDWPEWNRDVVSGGARAHRRYGEFRVDVVAPDHPIMQGVPSSFTLKDELYRFVPDQNGPPRTVLATAREEETGTVYPIIWTVQHPQGRIVVNTLGHDGEAHDHPAFQRILQNSLRWASRQVP